MILAHKRLIAAAAATAALAVTLVLCVSLSWTTAPAYALEQTAEANGLVTSYHVRITPAAQLAEAWIELDQDGTPLRLRMDFPKTEDGAKISIVSGDRAEVWFKDKNSHLIVRDRDVLAGFMKMRVLFDPKLAFEQLQADEKAGKVQIKTDEPGQEGQPIVLTATSPNAPDRRNVYEVDSDTKLVQRAIDYRLHGDQWEQVSVREYLDYSQPIDPATFQLQLPADVVTVDQINKIVGMAKEGLTNDEIATKVAREFFEALIAEDYEKAGQLYEGMPAEFAKKTFGRFKLLRIVEIGTPKAGKHPDPTAIQVPVKVEWEAEGNTMVREFAPYVRPVYKQPDRWTICGGI